MKKQLTNYLVRVEGPCPEHDHDQTFRIAGNRITIIEGDLLILEVSEDSLGEGAELKGAFAAGTWDSVIPESASNFNHKHAAQ